MWVDRWLRCRGYDCRVLFGGGRRSKAAEDPVDQPWVARSEAPGPVRGAARQVCRPGATRAAVLPGSRRVRRVPQIVLLVEKAKGMFANT